jgi:hypothetical protein
MLIFLVFCVVLLCVFTFWVPCCDVRYYFRIQTMFGSFLPPVVCSRAHVSLRFSQFSGCWLILSVYIIMSFDFPFGRLFGVLLTFPLEDCSEFSNFVITLIYVICVCLSIVLMVCKTYCAVLLLCLTSSCVSYVASVSWLSIFICYYGILTSIQEGMGMSSHDDVQTIYRCC